MLIGVDFDNTIVCYDQVFHQVALEMGLIPERLFASKGMVRDYLRQCGKEDTWIELQGYVYGPRMRDAIPFPDVLQFFSRCRQQGIKVCIVSHRTHYPYRGPQYDLHQAARDWLEAKGFFDSGRLGISPTEVHFELTKQDKLIRISALGCSHFIDDLPEFLKEPNFPDKVIRILFDPNGKHLQVHHFQRKSSWMEIAHMFC